MCCELKSAFLGENVEDWGGGWPLGNRRSESRTVWWRGGRKGENSGQYFSNHDKCMRAICMDVSVWGWGQIAGKGREFVSGCAVKVFAKVAACKVILEGRRWYGDWGMTT